jgi:hypothetical protein
MSSPNPTRRGAWAILLGTLAGLVLLARLEPASKVATVPPVVELAPLEGLEVESLGEQGGELGLVMVPVGARHPRPAVLVVPNGEPLRPLCERLRAATEAGVFVLCSSLQGLEQPVAGPSSPESRLPRASVLEARLRQTLRAAKKRFGQHLDAGSVVLVGLGSAAARAAALARSEPSFFSYVLLVGEPIIWTPVHAQVFAERGGRALVLGCVRGPCEGVAGQRAVLTTRLGARAKVALVDSSEGWQSPGILAEQLRWLTEADPRFAPGARGSKPSKP